MRICLYTDTALPKLGGQEMVVDSLAREFQRLALDVRVLAPRPRRPLLPRDEELPYPVVRHPRFYSTRAFVSWYRWWLADLSRRWPFEVLHCHGVYPPAYLAALLKPRLQVPLVVTSHGGDVHPNNIRLSRPAIRQRVEQGLHAADALVAISRFTRDNYRRLCPQAGPIVSIPNGVDTALLAQPVARPTDLDPAVQPKQYLLFLGRLAPKKGVDVLLRALALLPAVDQVRLVIAGDGNVRAELERLTAGLALGNQVRFVGASFHPAKTWLLQNALCTVVPSHTCEAFGLVVLESYAAGTPVIASQVPGLEDLIEPGRTGWLVPQNDPPALANELCRVLEQRRQLQALGAGVRHVAQRYDWTAVAEMHVRLYRELIARKRGSRRAS